MSFGHLIVLLSLAHIVSCVDYSYPSGIQTSYSVANLDKQSTSSNYGCSVCYEAPYANITSISQLTSLCSSGVYVLIGAINQGSTSLIVGAFVKTSFIWSLSTSTNTPVYSNGAYWYSTAGLSFGFSPSATISQDLDNGDSYGTFGSTDANSRLSWLLDGESGGARAGGNTGLQYEYYTQKVVYSCHSRPTSQPSGQPSRQPSSQPTSNPSSSQPSSSGLIGVFEIASLGSTLNTAIDIHPYIGSDYHSIAISATKVFVTGLSNTASFVSNPLSITGASKTVPLFSVFATNLQTKAMYTFGDSSGNVMYTSGLVGSIIKISSIGTKVSSGTLLLRTSINVGMDSLVCSGVNRIVIVDSDSLEVWNIDLNTGDITHGYSHVLYLGTVVDRWQASSGWAAAGVAEYGYDGVVWIVYATPSGTIERQAVAVGNSLSTVFSSGSMGDLSAFTIDLVSSMWYFVYTGSGHFGSYNVTLGSAAATVSYALPSSRPSNQPSSQPTNPTSMPSSSQPTINGLRNGIFEVAQLSNTTSYTVLVSAIGSELQALGFSNELTFISGNNVTVGVNYTTGAIEVAIGYGYATFVNELSSQALYTLGNASGDPLAYAGTVHTLVRLHPSTGAIWSSKNIKLNHGITLSNYAAVFSGHKRVVLVDYNYEAWNINTDNGLVIYLGTALPRWVNATIWATFGVAEYGYDDKVWLIYPTYSGTLERQQIGGTGQLQTVFSQSLGNISAFTCDPLTNRWIFAYTGTGVFGTAASGEVLTGHAHASFASILPSSRPSNQPSSQPTNPTSVPSTSQPTINGLRNGIFEIGTLDTTSVISASAASIGSTIQSIAIGGNNVFVAGLSSTMNINSSTMSIADSVTSLYGYSVLVTELSTRNLYALGNGSAYMNIGSTSTSAHAQFNDGGHVITELHKISSMTGQPTGAVISLNHAITIAPGSAVFSGHKRVVIVDHLQAVWNINTDNGHVLHLGTAVTRWAQSSSYVVTGVAEYGFTDKVWLVYPTAAGLIERQVIGAQNSTYITVANLGSITLTSVTVDPILNMWYYASGTSVYSAPASFYGHMPTGMPSSQPSRQPSLQPQSRPTSQPSRPSSQPTNIPTSRPTTSSPTGLPTFMFLEFTMNSRSYLAYNLYAFAALTVDGAVETWGDGKFGGNSTEYENLLSANITALSSGSFSFAAVTTNRSAIVWGLNFDTSSVSSEMNSNILGIIPNELAYAAIRSDGSVYCFGDSSHGGSMSTSLASQLRNVTMVTATAVSFAALKADGTVVSWGDSNAGGGVTTSTMPSLKHVVSLHATRAAFAALTKSEGVVTWGSSAYGGNSSAVESHISHHVKAVFSNQCAFAALKSDHSVVAWGGSFCGGNYAAVSSMLVDVQFIAITSHAFAATRLDRQVVAWGDSKYGGVNGFVPGATGAYYLFGNGMAFAALINDSTVMTWGDSVSGGNSSAVKSHLVNVVFIFHTRRAFAALLMNGSVVTWGYGPHGGDSSAVQPYLVNITYICSNEVSFTAITNTGAVVSWGLGSSGGNSSTVRGVIGACTSSDAFSPIITYTADSSAPTPLPTPAPSPAPTPMPSRTPTVEPTPSPTVAPTPVPTGPTLGPTSFSPVVSVPGVYETTYLELNNLVTIAAMAIDPLSLDLFVSTQSCVVRVQEGGDNFTVLAGGDTWGNVDGTGVGALLGGITDMVFDWDHNIYLVMQQYNVIKKITSAGVVSTVAGGSSQGQLDAVGTNAQFDSPTALVISPSNVIYVTDQTHGLVRVIASDGTVTTLAGGSSYDSHAYYSSTPVFADGVGTNALFSKLTSIVLDTSYLNLYVADGATIRKIVISTAEVSTVAGTHGHGATTSADGLRSNAIFSVLLTLSTLDSDHLVVCDTYNLGVRLVTLSTGMVRTLAGGARRSVYQQGPGYNASYLSPVQIASTSDYIYVGDIGPAPGGWGPYLGVLSNLTAIPNLTP